MRRIINPVPTFATALVVSIAACSTAVRAPDFLGPRLCSDLPSLYEFVVCSKSHIRGRGDGYEIPDAAVRDAWQVVVESMLRDPAGACATTDTSGISTSFSLSLFTDTETGKEYCALWRPALAPGPAAAVVFETLVPGQKSWGMFIVTLDAHVRKSALHFQVPHPLYDTGTLEQSTFVFAATGARSLLIAGAHRYANDGDPGDCDPEADARDYETSDHAHNLETMFLPTTRSLAAVHDGAEFTVVQFHGMSCDTCNAHVYMTWGTNEDVIEGTGLYELREALLDDPMHVGWKVSLPQDDDCDLHGSRNIDGRYLNGVVEADLCRIGDVGSSATGRFVHIEQDPGFRSGNDWVDAFDLAF